MKCDASSFHCLLVIVVVVVVVSSSSSNYSSCRNIFYVCQHMDSSVQIKNNKKYMLNDIIIM